MKQTLSLLIKQAIVQAGLDNGSLPQITIERTRHPDHGDFACNIAMQLARLEKKSPRELAEQITQAMPASPILKKVEIAGPGFINFYLHAKAQYAVIPDILEKKEGFGCADIAQGERVHIEFVSANPTGPLHVGHGRGAAYGAAVADLLTAVGFDVYREYYVNDAGRQMNILATSVWLRYLALQGHPFDFPKNGYKGEYIIDIAKQLLQDHGPRFAHETSAVFHDVPADEGEPNGDKEAHIDGLINNAKTLLADNYSLIFQTSLDAILNDIKADLAEFGVNYQNWYSEKQLMDNHAIERAIETLGKNGHTYQQDGALWFKSRDLGDDKDRVLVRDNGQSTYFASDVAYHMEKFARGFDRVIDVLGADHHGYVARVKASIQALGADPAKLDVLLVQFAILYRGKERIQMSTRSGSFVTLRDLRGEVGNDAARFFYVMRKSEQHMDFDLELAKSESADNPVYYIQYAHARICSVLKQLDEKAWQFDGAMGLAHLNLLACDHEKNLLTALHRYPEIIIQAATHYEPHSLAHYLRELAQDFHTYYNTEQFLVEDATLRNARLCLITATKQVIANGLQLLGVSAPETM